MAVSTIVINQFANIYGDAAIAAISIVQRIGQFSGALIMGFGQGFQPVCGFNYGAKKYRRVKQAFWFSARIMVSGMACMAVLLAVFAPQVIGFFRKDPDVLRIGVRALRLACLSMWLIPWIVINNMATQTMGMAAYASLLAVARQGLYLLPALVILDKLCGFGLGGILVSQPVSDFCAALTSLPICLQVMTKILKEHDTHTA
jgi:Na+-driven multidrug efflux pump